MVSVQAKGSKVTAAPVEGSASARTPPPAVAVTPRNTKLRIQVPVGELVGEHAVEPALQDRRGAVPPERELQDEQLRRGELGLLRLHVSRQLAGGIGFPGLDCEVARYARKVAEIAVAQNGVKSLGIEVRRRHLVAGRQRVNPLKEQPSVEGRGAGMGGYPQYVARRRGMGDWHVSPP